jgi:hypothetical protein
LASCERGLRLTLPYTKGERTGRDGSVDIPYGTTAFCPIRALRAASRCLGLVVADGRQSGGHRDVGKGLSGARAEGYRWSAGLSVADLVGPPC